MSKRNNYMILERYILSEHSADVIILLKKHKIWFSFINIMPISGLPSYHSSMFDAFYKSIYNFELYITSNDFELTKRILEEEGKQIARKFKGDLFSSYDILELKNIASNPQHWGFFYCELARLQLHNRGETNLLQETEIEYAQNYNAINSIYNEDIFGYGLLFSIGAWVAIFLLIILFLIYSFLHLALIP